MATVAALMLAGCSADITRFGGSGFSLNDDGRSGLLPNEPLSGTQTTTLSQATPETSYGTGSPARIRTAALPQAQGYAGDTPAATRAAPASSDVAGDRGAYRTADAAPAEGTAITVERGDTLYGLSRRHGVSVAELMAANGLDDSLLRVGQTLRLPAGTAAVAATPQRKTQRKTRREAPRAAEVAVAADIPPTWNASYTVRSGDSLYKIARQYGVTTGELQRYNAVTDPRRVMPGTVLRVPGGGSAPAASVAQAPQPPAAAATPATPATPTVINSGERYAALTDDTRNDASGRPASRGVRTVTITPPKLSEPSATPPVTKAAIETPEGGGGKLRWPVRGTVIAGFGARADGTHNDGINFAVPVGTDVHAADDGTVAYAGSELRSYGNLVLVRHENGWVTAYAHNDKLLVKRGDQVKRGQVIAKSGQTGQVDRPQVHFELRQSSKKPVDPLPHLERL